MAPLDWPFSDHEARKHGTYPYTLQRLLELEASYLVSRSFADRHPERRWRAFLAGQSPRSLHGFTGKLLKLHPEGRLV